MVAREFRLPDPGEGLVEADIVTWRVAVGDEVKVNDIVVEIETSKSLVELPTPYAGRVASLLVAEGATAEVGSPIIVIDDDLSGAADTAPTEALPAASDALPEVPETEPDEVIADGLIGGAAPGGRVAILVGYGPKTGEAKRRPRRSAEEMAPAAEKSAEPVAPAAAAPAPVARDLPLAKPPVRKLAKDLGVDLDALNGSGPGGVITREDVHAASSRPTGEASRKTTPTSAGDVRIPIKGVRKATAEAMVRSAYTSPHVSEWVTCDVSATMELVERLKARREFAGVRISPLLIVAKAVCLALARTPELNSFWDEPAQEIVLLSAVNLGIAAATPRGLVVPNIKDAQSLGLRDLAVALNELVGTAREGRTAPADMSGGTFTITNIGVFGVDAGTPILNPGESGIVCLGQITRQPWVVGTGADERIEPRWVTTLALSFDHRLADGAQGSTFLHAVASILGDPGLALLY